MAGTRSDAESATIAALLKRGHDETPVLDLGLPFGGGVDLSPPAPVALVYYDPSPWRGPVSPIPLTLDLFRSHALNTLTADIASAAGLPVPTIRGVMETLPGQYVTLLDDYFGWMILADAVADQLGIFDGETPLLTYPIH